jgi:hypothetical protein
VTGVPGAAAAGNGTVGIAFPEPQTASMANAVANKNGSANLEIPRPKKLLVK